MPKAIKGNAGRKPPEPSANHSDIDDWCRRLMPDLQPIVKRLDESIRATVPGLDYSVKWKRAYYGLPELGWIIEIAAYDVSVNVVFLGGADFESPPPLGTTDRTRYFKVTSLEEAQRPELRKWIENRDARRVGHGSLLTEGIHGAYAPRYERPHGPPRAPRPRTEPRLRPEA
jgi:hypothetical protein